MESKKSLKTLAYEEIRSRIVSCTYAPGAKLNEEMLQSELHVSRTPIRDALSRLEQEGLVKILPKKGVLVASFSREDIYMVYEMRLMLEPYVLLNYGQQISREKLAFYHDAFCAILQTGDLTNSYLYDDTFHETVLSVVTNRYILSSYDLLHAQTHRFRIASGNLIENRIRRSCEEHLAIVEACLNGNYTLSAEKMREHLVNARDATLSLVPFP